MSSDVFNIVLICSGNSCRSPIAEGLLKRKLPENLRDFVNITSAGTLGINGSPATPFAVQVAQEFGADISHHRSRGLTGELIHESDVIFVLANDHKKILLSHFPELSENIFLLKSFDRNHKKNYDENIYDPIGGSLETYRECAAIINEEINRIWPRLQMLIESKLGKRNS